jgi:hypothetical protein
MRHLISLVILCAPAFACSCFSTFSAKDAWLRSPAVFVGIVERTEPKLDPRPNAPPMSGQQVAWIRVVEPFKGVTKDQLLEFRDTFSSCFGGFTEGTELLLYAEPGRNPGTWFKPPCSRSSSPDEAVDDLRFLRGLPDSARGNRVSGVVGLWDDDPVKGFRRTRWFEGVRVRAIGKSVNYETVTDAEGVYEFRNLRPETYSIEIEYPKGTTLRFPMTTGGRAIRPEPPPGDPRTQIYLGENSGSGVDFVLAPETRITGRVLGPDSEPLNGVCVEIEPLEGERRIGSAGFNYTKKQGIFDLKEMPEGSYRIVANREGTPSASAPFGRLYYPGTTDRAKARIVTVVAGEPLDGIEIRVPSLAPRLRLQGRLVFNDGTPLPNASMQFESDDDKHKESGKTDAQGNFDMLVLSGNAGELSSDIWISTDVAAGCPQWKVKAGATTLYSQAYRVAGDQSLSSIQIVFPLPPCETWLKKQAEEKK